MQHASSDVRSRGVLLQQNLWLLERVHVLEVRLELPQLESTRHSILSCPLSVKLDTEPAHLPPAGAPILGITGSMVLPNDESCGIKYPKLVLDAASSADRWLAESSGEFGELGSCWRAAPGGRDTGPEAVDATVAGEAVEAEAADAGAEAEVEAALPLLRSFFCRSSSSSIFLCWSIFPEEGLLSAPPPGPVPLDEFIARRRRDSSEKVTG